MAGIWTVERLIDAEGKYSSKTIVYSPVVRGHIFKPTCNTLCFCPLVDMPQFSKWNKGYIYLLVVIDVFSKYV